eukprot:COSAG06_NODE_4165_length_4508_cov_8.097026_6_plen_65_part_00
MLMIWLIVALLVSRAQVRSQQQQQQAREVAGGGGEVVGAQLPAAAGAGVVGLGKCRFVRVHLPV